ncbi:1-aminocyclopropane-1-carboxylate deaminase/D-cysteine desulfhydrase [Kangiella taiwanensis]|uniref:Pyridoxal-phosphate dependent enzyme n=1 Tax=Kangiella taiwanensis TaxID=1079179 RepID=A0ABP8HT13_9GAMM|nr:pyridoxal-phosphate dependent enzyme [Kangiella taiwanensis]
MIELNHSPTQVVKWSLAEQESIRVDIKRDDLLHPVISGNKWRKLKYLLEDAEQKQCQSVISMGGNWSNHLHALAYAGHQLAIPTQGFVRAHSDQPLTPTLIDCKRWGMTLSFVTRKEYAELREHRDWTAFQQRFPKSYWIGEGGFSQLAMRGVEEIGQEVDESYDYVFVGCGSGATLCGLAKAFPKSQVVGVAAFSGAEYLQEQLQASLTQKVDNWTIDTEHHCGGFAKSTAELNHLIESIEHENAFELDAVYNGKVFLAVEHWLQQGKLPRDSRVLVIHTGGLQGKREVN